MGCVLLCCVALIVVRARPTVRVKVKVKEELACRLPSCRPAVLLSGPRLPTVSRWACTYGRGAPSES